MAYAFVACVKINNEELFFNACPFENSYYFSLTGFNKIAIQGTPQMAVDKEAICLSSLLI